MKRKVSKKQFIKFLKNYPRRLEVDVCGIWDPPLVTYNDFEIASKWPDSVVASTYKYSDNPNDYFYEPERDREYFIYDVSDRNKSSDQFTHHIVLIENLNIAPLSKR